MLKKWIKDHLPDKKTIGNHSSLGWLRNYLIRHPSLWYFNRYSIARGVAIGLFAAFIPLPMQMLIAVSLSIIFRANVPIAVVMTWVSNPFTFVPFNYAIYFIGAWILGEKVENTTTHISWISQFGKAYFVGLPVVAISLAVIGYFVVIIFWFVGRYFKLQKNKNTKAL